MFDKRTRPLAARMAIGTVMLCVVAAALLAGPSLASSAVRTLSTLRSLAYQAVSDTFWSGTGSYASKTQVVAGDVDGDGDSDVMQFYRGSGSHSYVYFFKSDGAHMVKSTAWSGTMAWAKTQVAAGDYNGDGKCDLLLLYDRGGSTCSVYLMTSSGSSLSAPTEIYRSASGAMAFSRARLTAGDPDNDHLAEAIVYYESGSGHAALKIIGKGLAQVQGTVRAAQGGAALAGVHVTLYDSGSVQIGSATTGADGSYAISVAAGTGYHAVFSASGYISATYNNINVSGVTSLETVKLVASGAADAGGASGFIKNAFDGTPVAGFALTLRAGYNTTSGSLAGYSAVTAADGSYSFTGVPGGYYTAQVSGTGFTTTFFTIVVVGGTTIGNQNMSVTPTLSGSDIRMVLTWGATPADLDSHLTGPPTSGSTRFHVYWSGMYRRYPTDSSQPVIALLDTDDRDGYGPETITLSRTSGGVYRYSIHDYTDRYATTGSPLAGSGAQVRVYKGSSLIATYNVPNKPGNLWKVLEINGDTMTPINTMSFHPNTDTVP